MAILLTGNSYSDNQQVTALTLNSSVNAATFASGAVDDVTTQLSSGAIIVKDQGINAAKLESGANGELFIGSGTGFTKATLTGGSGVTITNAASSITISSTGSISGTSGSTDNAIIRANGDLGSNIQSSAVLINDDNDISGARDISGTRDITAGNLVNVTSANGYQVNGTKVLGVQEGAISSITTPATDQGLSDLNNLVFSMNDKTNAILAALRAHGIIDT
jgi:hypothetical protein